MSTGLPGWVNIPQPSVCLCDVNWENAEEKEKKMRQDASLNGRILVSEIFTGLTELSETLQSSQDTVQILHRNMQRVNGKTITACVYSGMLNTAHSVFEEIQPL